VAECHKCALANQISATTTTTATIDERMEEEGTIDFRSQNINNKHPSSATSPIAASSNKVGGSGVSVNGGTSIVNNNEAISSSSSSDAIMNKGIKAKDSKEGGKKEKKEKGGGGFGAFSLCKPWMSPDPCDLKPFKPINLYPPPSILESLPGVPISSPFTSLAKPLVAKSILTATALGMKERKAAKKILDDKKKERDIVNKALEDTSAEKIARVANGEPPPGLLDDDENPYNDTYEPEDPDESKKNQGTEDDPCPVDASGN